MAGSPTPNFGLTLKRLVAIKMILAGEHAGPQERALVPHRGGALASLHHPNVVQIFDGGEHEGRAYFSMELVTGGSLKDRLAASHCPPARRRNSPLSLPEPCRRRTSAASSTRDLKPANVLLQRKFQITNTKSTNGTPACVRQERKRPIFAHRGGRTGENQGSRRLTGLPPRTGGVLPAQRVSGRPGTRL